LRSLACPVDRPPLLHVADLSCDRGCVTRQDPPNATLVADAGGEQTGHLWVVNSTHFQRWSREHPHDSQERKHALHAAPPFYEKDVVKT